MGKHVGVSGQEEEDTGGRGHALKPAAWQSGPVTPVTAEGGGAVTAPAHTARSSASPEGSPEEQAAPCHDATSWGGGKPEWSDGLEAKSSPSKARMPSL